MHTKLLAGDTALVTGAAGGIGRGIAAALAEEGATVFGADRPQAHLSRPGEAARLAQEAIRRLGRVSILVHAASPRREEPQKALAASEAQWREMLEVNLNAAFLLFQHIGKHMVEAGIKGRLSNRHLAEGQTRVPGRSGSYGALPLFQFVQNTVHITSVR